jgi:hypothetical protein
VGDDAALRHDEPAVRLVDDVHLRRQLERREASRDLGSIQHLVLDVVRLARAQDALEDLGAALDDPGRVQQLLAGVVLELVPELVRAAQQRDVVGMLEVGEPDDPRQPV